MEMIYDSIEDLPIWNWNKIQETSDYTYLRITRINGQITSEQFKTLKATWEKLFSQYIDMFGFSENFWDKHLKRKEIAFLQKQMIETRDRSVITFIELAKKELAKMNEGEGENNFYKTKTILEKFLGFQVDIKKTSVVEFHSYLEMIKQERKSA